MGIEELLIDLGFAVELDGIKSLLPEESKLIIDFVESLKNCGNCGSQDGYDCRACERYEDNDSTYKNVTVNDQWQPMK